MQLVLSLIPLFCFVLSWEAFPLVSWKGPFKHIVGGCIQSLNNWPEVWSSLSWIHAREELLTTTALLNVNSWLRRKA